MPQAVRSPRAGNALRRFLACGCVALVLGLGVLAVCPELHEWLHGDHGLADDDGCIVTLFSHGLTEAAVAVIVAVGFFLVAGNTPVPPHPDFPAPRRRFPPCCGPPCPPRGDRLAVL